MSTLIDSDVLVWLMRGLVGAAQRLHALNHWRVSAVIVFDRRRPCASYLKFALIAPEKLLS
jgi:hypothetical protein